MNHSGNLSIEYNTSKGAVQYGKMPESQGLNNIRRD